MVKDIMNLIDISEKEIALRLAYLRLTEEDKRLLREAFPVVEKNLDSIADKFYEHLLNFEEAREILGTESRVKGLKRSLKQYLCMAFNPTLDKEYFQSRVRIGQTHYDIGVWPKWYLGAYSLLKTHLAQIITRGGDDVNKALSILAAMDKIFFLDSTLAMDTYIQCYIQAEKELEQEWEDTFNSIEDLISIHDGDFNILKANRAMYNKFNITQEAIGRKKCFEVFHGTNTRWPSCPLARSKNLLKHAVEEVDDPHMGGCF